MIRRISVLAVAALIAAPALAQHEEAERGQRLFVERCSACHGDTGKGGRGPDLTAGEWKHGGSDADLIRNITKGIAGTQMPPVPMADNDARAVVAFLRAAGGGADRAEVKGDPEAGRRLFHGAAGCAKCHMFGGRGGRLGPDLTQARARLTAAKLLAAMDGAWKRTVVTPKTGAPVRGFAKNDDTFTLHLMDENERWHFFDRRAVKAETSEAAHPKLNPQDREAVAAFLLKAPITYDAAAEWKPEEPWNWLMYFGDYAGRHASGLKQITPANAASLKSQWTYQMGGERVETTPIVVGGMMFVTGPLNNAAALDARTGRPIWKYTRRLPEIASHCTVMTNRGVAVYGDRLYMATLDTRLVALDAKTGNVIWDVEVDDYRKGFSITHAPLVAGGKVFVGVTSGECALTGFLDAYDAATGKKLWRTHTTPQPGDPNRKTWDPETTADFGGSPTWTTGTYDTETDTLFWATGNPGPDYEGRVRLGDNLYSCSVLAIDPKTGRMKWWFQYTPHDVHDWDGNQTPMLIEGAVKGKRRKLLVSAQRNAFYYVLDRETGEFLTGQAFARQTWAKGLDAKGRPVVLPNTAPTPEGNYVCPDALGAANWGSPSYDAQTGFFLVSVREACATYTSVTKSPVPGQGYTGGGQELDPKIGTPGAVRALDALTGGVKWNFPLKLGAASTGVLATAGGVAFASSNDGNLIALDAKTGRYLWHYYTGANITASPMSYAVDGKQYVAIASQSAVFVFALP